MEKSSLIVAVLAGATGAAAIYIGVTALRKNHSQNPSLPPPPSGSFTPGSGGTTNPGGPATGPAPGTAPPPTSGPPQPNPNLAPVLVTVLAQNGKWQSFVITSQDYDALQGQIDSTTGYISNTNFNPGQSVNSTLADVLSFISKNQ